MYTITDEQIDYILDDLRSRGISLEGLQQSLLDHICVLIEENLAEDGDFEAFYATVIRRFYKQELREIEDATILLAETRGWIILLTRNQFFGWLFVFVIFPFLLYAVASIIDDRSADKFLLPLEIWGGTFLLAILLCKSRLYATLCALLLSPLIVSNLNSLWQLYRAGDPPVIAESLMAISAFLALPMLIFLVLWLTPEQLDPLIPRGSRIILGRRPFFRVIAPPSVETLEFSQPGLGS